MPKTDIPPLRQVPDLSKLEDKELARKLTTAFNNIFEYVDFHIKEISTKTETIATKQTEQETLVQPFIDNQGNLISDPDLVTAGDFSSFGEQTANKVLASPDGNSGDASFRSLVENDIPDALGLDKLNSKVVHSDMAVSGGSPIAIGTVKLSDNLGNDINVLVT